MAVFKIRESNDANAAIEDYPSAKDLIIDEFQLPEDRTEFVKDSRWDLGHGRSDEF